MSFQLLGELIRRKDNPTVMGLDPREEYIPASVRSGRSLGDAIFEFNRRLIDCTADIIPAVKPQAAFYEMYGAEGREALSRTVKYAKEAGLYVILDFKRGDIGSTAEAYAEAAFGQYSDGADCVTVNGYLGSDGVLPFVGAARRYDRAIFVLVKTSNPSSSELQDLICDGRTVYRRMGELVEKWGADTVGSDGFSRVGAVVGATYPAELAELRRELPHTFFLVPGYGAQGGDASSVAGAFTADGGGAVVNNSRGLMCAYRAVGDPEGFEKHTREAALKMRDALRAAIAGK